MLVWFERPELATPWSCWDWLELVNQVSLWSWNVWPEWTAIKESEFKLLVLAYHSLVQFICFVIMVQFCLLWILFHFSLSPFWSFFSLSWRRGHDFWDMISPDLHCLPKPADHKFVQRMSTVRVSPSCFFRCMMSYWTVCYDSWPTTALNTLEAIYRAPKSQQN